ncbi:NAD-dependent epimerase/dehydratase family protein [Hymenobacter monticola]|uniref:NAD-dependent epimerase/dehydratase family protein n=1 Tax=Hymenobacter monticola TaxID=1705399 RepID=A0ABY4AZA8_9BACT|nr:NAD-dependent epimerase/dehydratase family protein [Hymenobacter monticola]UOE31859.1 NAD-dependent epimerase/dehydratase family protein [Hymenobacter monticola]
MVVADIKAVVLGATGFVGQSVTQVLRRQGVAYVGASRALGVDLRDPAATAALLRREQPTHIVNCAANVGSLNYVTEQAGTVIADNVRMALSLYEAVARECPQAIVINPIANCAYPAEADVFREEDWLEGPVHRSVLSYGASRRLLWNTAECFAMQHGVKSIHLLTPNMYGPYDSTDPNKTHALNALVAKFVKARLACQPQLVVWGTGAPIREWLYAPDFGRLVWEVMQHPDRPGLEQPTNLAQNSGLSVRELVTLMQRTFNYQGQIIWDAAKPDGALKKVMNNARFRCIFPAFQFTPIDDGIAATARYYESIYPY